MPSENDTISILIATDNHLGYLEKDPIRGNDSFQSFEEILEIAQTNQVDFILLGGDLFHDNKPSRKCTHKSMALLREYCMGDRPCQVDILSDQSVNFPNGFYTANYFDPNLNIGMPVFSIHGNHDDPSGDGALCALDLLSVSGLLNYFGKFEDADNVQIAPILMQKGDTKLALYGLGNIRDERLHRTFEKGNVSLLRPKEDANDWFNLFVIHQNRVAHGHKNYIPEDFLDSFIDLVLWGHEHECLINPVTSSNKYDITQPGSSVATSLSEGESVEKHVAILRISKQKYKLEKIRLKTVRPFVIGEVALNLNDSLDPNDTQKVSKFLATKVQAMIDEARIKWSESNSEIDIDEFPKPLIRLKVEYSGGFTAINPHRFGHLFIGKVANPMDILQFYRKKQMSSETRKAELADFPERLDAIQVEDLVQEFLDAQKLDLLPESALGEAVKTFVEKDDKDAIKDFVGRALKKTRLALQETSGIVDSSEIESRILLIKQQMTDKVSPKKKAPSSHASMSDSEESVKVVPKLSRKRKPDVVLESDDEPVHEVVEEPVAKPSRRRKQVVVEESDDEVVEQVAKPARKRKQDKEPMRQTQINLVPSSTSGRKLPRFK